MCLQCSPMMIVTTREFSSITTSNLLWSFLSIRCGDHQKNQITVCGAGCHSIFFMIYHSSRGFQSCHRFEKFMIHPSSRGFRSWHRFENPSHQPHLLQYFCDFSIPPSYPDLMFPDTWTQIRALKISCSQKRLISVLQKPCFRIFVGFRSAKSWTRNIGKKLCTYIRIQ